MVGQVRSISVGEATAAVSANGALIGTVEKFASGITSFGWLGLDQSRRTTAGPIRWSTGRSKFSPLKYCATSPVGGAVSCAARSGNNRAAGTICRVWLGLDQYSLTAARPAPVSQ